MNKERFLLHSCVVFLLMTSLGYSMMEEEEDLLPTQSGAAVLDHKTLGGNDLIETKNTLTAADEEGNPTPAQPRGAALGAETLEERPKKEVAENFKEIKPFIDNMRNNRKLAEREWIKRYSKGGNKQQHTIAHMKEITELNNKIISTINSAEGLSPEEKKISIRSIS